MSGTERDRRGVVLIPARGTPSLVRIAAGDSELTCFACKTLDADRLHQIALSGLDYAGKRLRLFYSSGGPPELHNRIATRIFRYVYDPICVLPDDQLRYAMRGMCILADDFTDVNADTWRAINAVIISKSSGTPPDALRTYVNLANLSLSRISTLSNVRFDVSLYGKTNEVSSVVNTRDGSTLVLQSPMRYMDGTKKSCA